MLAYPAPKHVGGEISEQPRKRVESSDSPVKVLGKLCPCCGVVGPRALRNGYEDHLRVSERSPVRNKKVGTVQRRCPRTDS